MPEAPDTLVGRSIEWTGVHHSEHGDFTDISTHIVTYETADTCYVTAGGKLVGEARYTYKRLDERMAIVIYYPGEYQGRSDVVLHAMFDFAGARIVRFSRQAVSHSRLPTAACVRSRRRSVRSTGR